LPGEIALLFGWLVGVLGAILVKEGGRGGLAEVGTPLLLAIHSVLSSPGMIIPDITNDTNNPSLSLHPLKRHIQTERNENKVPFPLFPPPLHTPPREARVT
jgi:hypothetical protein